MKLPIRNTDNAYGLVAQLLHWAVVIGITLQFVWAWRIEEADSIRQQFQLVTQHKSIGMTVLLLVLVRIGWRLFNRPPSLPADLARWEQRAARWTHVLLYALILAMPLSGWAWSSSAGYGAEFFGLLDIPGLVPDNEWLEDVLEDVHEWLARAMLVVVAVHVLAALRHQLVLRDNVLERMLPIWK